MPDLRDVARDATGAVNFWRLRPGTAVHVRAHARPTDIIPASVGDATGHDAAMMVLSTMVWVGLCGQRASAAPGDLGTSNFADADLCARCHRAFPGTDDERADALFDPDRTPREDHDDA